MSHVDTVLLEGAWIKKTGKMKHFATKRDITETDSLKSLELMLPSLLLASTSVGRMTV